MGGRLKIQWCYSNAAVIITNVGIGSSTNNNDLFADRTSSLSGAVSIGGNSGGAGVTLTDVGIPSLTGNGCGWTLDVLASR